jgi:cysteinyl-tRNA synthetase
MLKIYNTLTRKKQQFQPRVAGKVGMYVCGMTVYDYCHIGHARVMVVFDTVARYFRYLGYDLVYVRNITDIDDKIIHRANESKNGDCAALTEEFITAMHEDEYYLSVQKPKHEPQATQSIPDIITMIEKLIRNGYAYVGGNGDVFYAVQKFKDYGQLSGKNLDELQAGERVDVDLAKNNPLDFVLWKMAKPDEPFWQSPWGNGRPGWHIECSAMSTCCLGDSFDIHGGGMDLQFPHHENEIAQSEGATGQKFVNFWMHNGFVRVDKEKMSKSLGNFFTVREVLDHYMGLYNKPKNDEDYEKYRKNAGEIIRLFILDSHYRSPLNYSEQQLKEAITKLNILYKALRNVDIDVTNVSIDDEYQTRFERAMNNDFNTHEALVVLLDIAGKLNKAKANKGILGQVLDRDGEKYDQEKIVTLASTLKQLGGLLGLLQINPEKFLGNRTIVSLAIDLVNEISDANVEQQIQARIAAKLGKDWATADKIRNELKAQGVILEDAPDGTTRWRRE